MRTIKSIHKKDYTGKHYEGDFYCFHNNLKSLEGAPTRVRGNFYCANSNLESLEGSPKTIGGNFYCYGNKLTSLEGAPMRIGGDFYCDENLINGDNIYIIANALLNGRRDRGDFEEEALAILTVITSY